MNGRLVRGTEDRYEGWGPLSNPLLWPRHNAPSLFTPRSRGGVSRGLRPALLFVCIFRRNCRRHDKTEHKCRPTPSPTTFWWRSPVSGDNGADADGPNRDGDEDGDDAMSQDERGGDGAFVCVPIRRFRRWVHGSVCDELQHPAIPPSCCRSPSAFHFTPARRAESIRTDAPGAGEAAAAAGAKTEAST